jgi:hypothetical protein
MATPPFNDDEEEDDDDDDEDGGVRSRSVEVIRFDENANAVVCFGVQTTTIVKRTTPTIEALFVDFNKNGNMVGSGSGSGETIVDEEECIIIATPP